MTTANVTAVQAEVLYSGAPFANVTALGSEVLYSSGNIKANVASFGLQTFITLPYEQFQSISNEVLYTPRPNVDMQSISMEVLLQFVPDAAAPGKMSITKQMRISKQLSIRS